MIYYTWTLVNAFLDSYTSLFSMLTLLAGAFVLSFVFPGIGWIIFCGALGLSVYNALYKANQARKTTQSIEELQQNLQELQQTIEDTKEEHHKNKNEYDKLNEEILQLERKKLILRNLLADCDIIKEKLAAMSKKEKADYMQSPTVSLLMTELSHLNVHAMTTEEMLSLSKTLDSLIEPSLRERHRKNAEEKHDTSAASHAIKPKPAHLLIAPPPIKKVEPQSGFKSWLPAIGVGLKITLLSFAFALSIVTLAAMLALSMGPMAMIAAAPLTVLAVSLTLAVTSLAIGAACSVLYKKVIEPQIESNKLIAEQSQHAQAELDHRNQKLALEKEYIATKHLEVERLKEDIIIEANPIADLKNIFHPKVEKKLGVEEALRVAAHPKIQPQSVAVDMVANAEKNALLNTMINNLSPKEKEELLNKLQAAPQNKPETPTEH